LQELRVPPLLTMHNVSLPTFQQLARHFVDSLPSIEVSFNVPDILAQWVAGVVQVRPQLPVQHPVIAASHMHARVALPCMQWPDIVVQVRPQLPMQLPKHPALCI
jgi:hypothetical protein